MTIKDNIRRMNAYSVPRVFDGAKLNQNESPVDIPREIKEAVFKQLEKTRWNRYPDDPPETLIRKIAAYTDFPEEGIMAGNSSNELIRTIIHACCNSGDRLLTVTPTFSVYRRVASVMNIDAVTVPLDAGFSFDVPAIIEKLGNSKRIKAIFLASPNNPTGTTLELDDIERIAAKTPALLVMDEAYFEFHGVSAQSLVEKYENVVILRTFSKALRSAGVRLGYLLGREPVVSELKKATLPFSVGFFQRIAGEAVLDNRDLLLENINSIRCEREQMFNRMQTIPSIRPVPSKANFILFRSEVIPADVLFRSLGQLGVWVRAYNDPELTGMLRVSIGTPAENAMFIGALRALCPAVALKIAAKSFKEMIS